MANLNMTEMSDEILFQSKNSDPGKIKATSEKISEPPTRCVVLLFSCVRVVVLFVYCCVTIIDNVDINRSAEVYLSRIYFMSFYLCGRKKSKICCNFFFFICRTYKRIR